MKVFIAVMSHETNVFSPIPTSLADFRANTLYLPEEGDDDARVAALKKLEGTAGAGDFVRLARERGHDAVIGPIASAHPAGMVVKAAYETIRDSILKAFETSGADAALLFLHGAQVADGYDDCEGDLLVRLRTIAGADKPIGALLDLHGALTADMMRAATALIFCKEYPHIDYAERAVELMDIIEGAHDGALTPAMTRIAVPCLGGLHTMRSPGKDLVDRARAAEGKNGVLSVSVVHGFGLADVADASAQILVVSNNAAAQAEKVARDLGAHFYEIRGSVQSAELPIVEAVEAATAAPAGPVVISEPGDNPGGGWGSDNVDILRQLVQADADAACALIYDPTAVQLCFDAGAGARINLRIGGKIGSQSGKPLDVECEIVSLNEQARQRTIFSQHPALFGPAAAVRIGRVYAVLSSVRTQPFSPDVFSELGIEPTERKILAIKSSQHFQKYFAPIAAQVVYCNGRGEAQTGRRTREYMKLKRPVWPLEDPGFDAATAPVEHFE